MTWLTDRRRVLIGRTMAVVSIALSVVAFGLYLILAPSEIYSDWIVHNASGGVELAILGWLLVSAQPRNRAAWLFPWMALFQALNALGVALMREATERLGLPPWPAGVPLADLGLTGSVGTVLAETTWVPGIAPLVTLALLWFPDGRLPSSRWRPVEWLAIAATAGLTFGLAWPVRPFGAVLRADEAAVGPAVDASFLALGLAMALSMAGIVVRYRGSGGEVRRKLRWVAWASGTMAGLWLITFPIDLLVSGRVAGPAFQAVSLVSSVLFLGGYAIAIVRHQLFDIDVVISRTLLFGSLAAFIGAVYVAVVFGIGELIGRQGSNSQTLSLVATVVVAFLFHPVRQRFERLANRLVYGPRATPYEVLSDLSSRLARTESTDGLLKRMAALVAEGTGAERAEVWRWSESGYEPLAVWPPDAAVSTAGSAVGFDSGAPTNGDAVVPIERAGERLGALTVTKRRGDELNTTEQRLLNDLAGSAGLVLEQSRLNAALSSQAAALVRSRRRLVGAQDEERHRLERQLQRGAQRQLTVLAVGLDGAVAAAATDDLGPVAEQLAALRKEIQTAQREIRALAQGVYPPVLEAEGLAAAVESLSAGLPIPVDVRSIGDQRFDLDIELAVYFCIAEALTNVVKHARATSITVLLDQEQHGLSFEVSDDGTGIRSTNGNGSGTGLVGLHDRIAAVGGRLSVTSAPGRGTTVAGSFAGPATTDGNGLAGSGLLSSTTVG